MFYVCRLSSFGNAMTEFYYDFHTRLPIPLPIEVIDPSTRKDPHHRIIQTGRSDRVAPQVIVNMFQKWFADLGYEGCSSHSGRRTFITNASKKITSVGGSLRDIQYLAGHSSLQTTQRYIEGDSRAREKVVRTFLRHGRTRETNYPRAGGSSFRAVRTATFKCCGA